MTTANLNAATTSPKTSLFARVGTTFSSFLRPIAYLRASEQQRRMRNMDDAMLRDVGLSRKDIEGVSIRDLMAKPRCS